ncbi:MAG: Hsp20/alpha crystallin family protein [Fibrobacteria bacterium]|nr:Hsp20/alpha crystallin family protein [Fibrobacteria bacterium]
MTEQILSDMGKREVAHTGAEQLVDAGTAFSPDMDIFMSENELLFIADLPGVAKGDVSIEIDENNALLIKAQNSLKEPEKVILRQFNLGNYYRAFQIGQEYDKDKAKAVLENGQLELRIPKREAVKPKRISINA